MTDRQYKLHGALAYGDQRLAERNGLYYLFDYSGPSPDQTDDGPLTIVPTSPIFVDKERCIVRVFRERTECSARIGITHKGALRLRKMVPGLRFELDLADVGDLWNLLAAIERDAAEREQDLRLKEEK